MNNIYDLAVYLRQQAQATQWALGCFVGPLPREEVKLANAYLDSLNNDA